MALPASAKTSALCAVVASHAALPVRGQRTRTNARTRRGARKPCRNEE